MHLVSLLFTIKSQQHEIGYYRPLCPWRCSRTYAKALERREEDKALVDSGKMSKDELIASEQSWEAPQHSAVRMNSHSPNSPLHILQLGLWMIAINLGLLQRTARMPVVLMLLLTYANIANICIKSLFIIEFVHPPPTSGASTLLLWSSC